MERLGNVVHVERSVALTPRVDGELSNLTPSKHCTRRVSLYRPSLFWFLSSTNTSLMPISGKKGGVIVERTFNRSFRSIYIVRTAPFCNEQPCRLRLMKVYWFSPSRNSQKWKKKFSFYLKQLVNSSMTKSLNPIDFPRRSTCLVDGVYLCETLQGGHS